MFTTAIATSAHSHAHSYLGDCTPDLSILQTSNGQLTLDDMIGVLYVVYCGIVVGLACIVLEWCVASFWDVDPTDPKVIFIFFSQEPQGS
jgi:hypothetical protein